MDFWDGESPAEPQLYLKGSSGSVEATVCWTNGELMLLAASGVEIDIRIAGYEFIDNPTDGPNWLLFEGRVRHPRGNWQFRVPAMEVLEAVRLADWLDAVREGIEDVPWCLFADSYLAFGTPGGFEPRVLQVFFGREARAP